MPKIKVTSPQGQTAIINVPDGATQDEIKAYAQQKFAEIPQQKVEGPKKEPQKDDSLLRQVNGKPPLLSTVIRRGVDRYLKPENAPLLSSKLMEPGGRDIVVDSAGMGFGNEAVEGVKALYKSATDGQGPEKTFGDYYNPGMAETEGRKDAFRKENPVASTIGSVVPAMATGTGVARVLNPKGALGAIGYGVAEGATFGAGEAKPGLENRTKGGAIGGALGATASTVIPLAVKLATKGVPKMVKGLSDMFSEPKPQSARAAKADGDKFLANFYEKTGLTKEKVAELSNQKFDPNETLADVTSEQSSVLLPGLAASSDEAADVARKSNIATRQDPDTLMKRVQEASGAGEGALDNATAYSTYLKKRRQDIGAKIDDRITSTLSRDVGNTDAIDEFFALDAAKGLKREVNESLQLRKRGPNFTEAEAQVDDFGVLLDDAGDTNRQIHNEAFIQETSSRLGKRIQQMRNEGVDVADAKELKTQWEEIADGALGDNSKLKRLRGEYATASKRDRAFKAGLDGKDSNGKPFGERTLKAELSSLDKKDLDAFRKGAAANYAEKGDDLLKALGSPTERRRIGMIFGGDTAEGAKSIAEREGRFATISDKLLAGTTGQSQKVARDTMKGDLDGVESLFKRLEGKRAYSPIGAAGLFVNEVVSIIHSTKLSDQAINSMMKTVSTSGDDINKVLKRMATVDMPENARNRLIKEEMSKLAKAVTSGSGGVAGSLSERLLGSDN